MEILQNYMNVSILIVCGIVGYLWKNTTKFANNYIPLVVTVLGAVLACLINKGVSIETICVGMVSGLASTGLHQLITQLIDKFAKTVE